MALRTSSYTQSRLLPFSVILFLFLVYAFLPTQNSTSDAYDYAASVRWRVDLWKPHHLLYNITGLGLHSFLKRLGVNVEPLPLLQFMNSLFGGASLVVLWRIVAQLQKDVKVQAALLLVAGASFGSMRYATENETYIIPLFFSSLGSLYVLRYLQQGKASYVFWGGWWASIACLYHQVHFFWWLGLCLYILLTHRNRLSSLKFLLPGLIVPLVYGLVMYLQGIPVVEAHRFVFSAFYKGSVETTITYKNFLLTGISFFRTFFEVHGRLAFLLKLNPFYIIVALFTISLVLYLLKELLWQRKTILLSHPYFFKMHTLILVLQMVFAWYAVGNAEFMVMVPYLVVLLASCFLIEHSKYLFLFGLSLFTWNTAFGLLPNYLYTFSNHACVSRFLGQHRGSVLLLQDKNAFDTYFFYHTGSYPENTYETEASPKALSQAIKQGLMKNKTIVTDYTKEAAVINRNWFLKSNKAEAFFSHYKLIPITTCPTFFSKGNIYNVVISPASER